MIHPSAVIEQGAVIGSGVEVGPFTVVYSNAEVGPNSTIGSHCSIGYPTPLAHGRRLTIGEGAVVRSHSTLYEGSTFGDRLETGHHVTVRERTEAGRNLRIGTMGDIQGDVHIGDFVRLHSNVFISKLAKLGNFVWLFPHVVFTNDPTPPSSQSHHRGVVVEDFAVIAAMSCIAPGITIGRGAFVAAMSMVTRNVAAASAVRGAPARPIGPAADIVLRGESNAPAYPWTRHFSDGYPTEIVTEWLHE